MRKLLVLAVCLALAGCGFRLRGTADVPFETVYVPGATGGAGVNTSESIRLGERTARETAAQIVCCLSGVHASRALGWTSNPE